MTEQAFFYSFFILFLLINEGKETNIFNTHALSSSGSRSLDHLLIDW